MPDYENQSLLQLTLQFGVNTEDTDTQRLTSTGMLPALKIQPAWIRDLE